MTNPDPDWRTAVARVREIHAPHPIYDECDCTDKSTPIHIEVDDVGITCNLMYVICENCCCTYGEQTEHCASTHTHSRDTWHCDTAHAVDITRLELA